MLKQIRYQLIVALTVLGVLAAACSSAPVETIDRNELISAAVATVEAQQSARSAAEAAVEAELVVADLTDSAEAETIPIAGSMPAADMTLSLQDTLIELYKRVNPSVVYISIRSGQFEVGNGSGFVYDADGHIVTNNHVVENGEGFEVVFGDGSRRAAVVVGRDPDSDLAVIKVNSLPDGIGPLPLSDLSDVAVGQFVVAIGSPFQQENSMSLGIVSALGRSLQSQRLSEQSAGFYSLPQVIQTDAPINPGNSGGPLLNLAGEVVGVNSAIRTATGVNSGVGFSIPVNAVKRIAPSLISDGSYQYPYMGVGIGSVDVELAEELGLDEARGALISRVSAGTPASVAGLVQGDVVIRIDDRSIRDFSDLNSYLVFETEVGQTIEIELVRGGEVRTLDLTLGARP